MRRKLNFTIDKEGRDFGKTFLIVEMPASQVEYFVIKVFLALMKGGVELPDGMERSGLYGLFAFGVRALSEIPLELAKDLLIEMWSCVKIIPDPKGHANVSRDLIEEDVEEWTNRLFIREQIIHLHTDFFTNAGLSSSNLLASA